MNFLPENPCGEDEEACTSGGCDDEEFDFPEPMVSDPVSIKYLYQL